MKDYIKKIKLVKVEAELEKDLTINQVVLGVDVSMHNTGLAVIRTTGDYLILDILHNIIVPKKIDLLTGVDLFLSQISEFKQTIAQKYKLDKMIIEDCYLATYKGFRGVRTANVESLKTLARFGILVYDKMRDITNCSEFMKATTARCLVNYKKTEKGIKGIELKKEIIAYVNNALQINIKDDNQSDAVILALASLVETE